MKLRSAALFALPFTLAACGGGSGGSSGSSSAGPVQAQNVSTLVAPVQGEKRVYTTTIANLDGATATHSFFETIAQVNADGSYVANWSDDDYVLDGNHYGNDPWTYVYNNVGDIIGLGTIIDPYPNNCTYTYPSGGRPVTMQTGQTWDDSYVEKCPGNSGGTSTTQNGTYLGVENITVPAGRFQAYKFQLVQPYSSTYTITFTNWYDASSTDSRLVRQLWQYSYGSQTPNGQATNYMDLQLSSY